MDSLDPAAEEPVPQEEAGLRDQAEKEAGEEPASCRCSCQPGYDLLPRGVAPCGTPRAEVAEPQGTRYCTSARVARLCVEVCAPSAAPGAVVPLTALTGVLGDLS